MNSFVVYKHTTPSGKVYIGITKQSPTKRWKNGQGYEGCTAFYRAVQKYGWTEIKHEIVASGLDKESACLMEQELIKKYDSTNPERGYNLTSGGEHYEPTDEWRMAASESHKEYYEQHPEARERISEQQKGRKLSKETRQRQSESRTAYILSHPETREKCRQTFTGMKRSAEQCEKLGERRRKKTICSETLQIFESVNAAAAWAGVPRTSVSNVLSGKSQTAGGYHFKYYEA